MLISECPSRHSHSVATHHSRPAKTTRPFVSLSRQFDRQASSGTIQFGIPGEINGGSVRSCWGKETMLGQSIRMSREPVANSSKCGRLRFFATNIMADSRVRAILFLRGVLRSAANWARTPTTAVTLYGSVIALRPLFPDCNWYNSGFN